MRTMTTLRSYADAIAFLKGKEQRKIGHKCYLVLRGNDAVAVRYHNTDIVTYYPNGSININNGGYRTVTTKRNINRYSPFSVFQKDFDWFIVVDGITSPFNVSSILVPGRTDR